MKRKMIINKLHEMLYMYLQTKKASPALWRAPLADN